MTTNTKSFIGVISDTHNLLRSQALQELRGADLIIHAGDVCKPRILEDLRAVAPVIAVRGNNDKGTWAEDIPEFEIVQIGEIFIYVVHDLKDLKLDPVASGYDIVISGHSHKPLIRENNGVLSGEVLAEPNSPLLGTFYQQPRALCS